MPVEAVALVELASYIEESSFDGSTVPVFKMSDLTKLYIDRLKQLGEYIPNTVVGPRKPVGEGANASSPV